MKAARKKPPAAKLRSWRVSIIRKRGQYLGTVEAPNEKAAEAAAVAEFDLSDEQRRRLVVHERNLRQAVWAVAQAGMGVSKDRYP
jgi:hypothetical protein